MSRAHAVRAFLQGTDGLHLQVDDAYKHVTDDFLYQFQPKPTGIDFNYPDGGLNKAKYKEFCAKVATRFNSFKVSL